MDKVNEKIAYVKLLGKSKSSWAVLSDELAVDFVDEIKELISDERWRAIQRMWRCSLRTFDNTW